MRMVNNLRKREVSYVKKKDKYSKLSQFLLKEDNIFVIFTALVFLCLYILTSLMMFLDN